MRAIGLSGFGQSGKTTAALYLEEKYGIRRKHIAEPMRDMLAVLLRYHGISEEMINRYLTGDLKDGVIIPELGVTSRHLQITLGTQWGRENVGPNLWSDTWKCGIARTEKVMNDSVRFSNEEKAITDLGGFSILIERPNTGPIAWKKGWKKLGPALHKRFGWLIGAHDSERVDRLNPKYVVLNNGSLEYLYLQLDAIMHDEKIYPVRESRLRLAA